MTAKKRTPAPKRSGPEATGAVIKRYRKRDRQHVYGLRLRVNGERY